MNAPLRVILRSMALAWLLAAVPASAYGHAAVVDTSPPDGALLQSAPDRIVVRFNEPAMPISAQVLNAAGEDILGTGAVRMEGAELHIHLPAAVARGSYVASYRVVSADSHPVAGSIVFSVGTVSDRLPMGWGAVDEPGWWAAMVALRAVLFAGIMGGAGGVLFLIVATPDALTRQAAGRFAGALSIIGGLAALIAIGVQGALLRAGPAADLMHPDTWRLGLTSSFGTSAVVAFAGLILIAAGLRMERKGFRSLAWVGAAFALASFALSGHIVSAGPRWITVPVLLAHTAAVAFWLGSLLPLRYGVVRMGGGAAGTIQRFSRSAVGAVALLAISGLIIAALQVRGLQPLVATGYGQLLLAKIALFAGLLGLAVLNKVRLTPGLACGSPAAVAALNRTIAAEIALAAGILVITAMLGTTVPPRVLSDVAESHAGHLHPAHEHASQGLSLTVDGSAGTAEIRLESHRSGPNAARIRLSDRAGAPLNAMEVNLTAANASAGVEAIRRAAVALEPGAWQVNDLVLVPPGSWSLKVDALISDFETTRFETEVTLEQ